MVSQISKYTAQSTLDCVLLYNTVPSWSSEFGWILGLCSSRGYVTQHRAGYVYCTWHNFMFRNSLSNPVVLRRLHVSMSIMYCVILKKREIVHTQMLWNAMVHVMCIKCILFPNMFSSGDNVLARSSAIVRTSMATCSIVWPHLWPSTRRILGFKDFTCRVAETEGGNWWYGYDPIEGFGWWCHKICRNAGRWKNMSHHDIGNWQSRHLWFDKASQRGYLRAQNPTNYFQMQNSRKKKLLMLGRLVISSASDFSMGWFSHPNMTIIDIFQVGGKESTKRPEIISICPAFAVSSGYHCAQVAYQPHLSQWPLHHRWSRPGTQQKFHLVSKGPHGAHVQMFDVQTRKIHDIYHHNYHDIYHVVTSCCSYFSIFVHDMFPPHFRVSFAAQKGLEDPGDAYPALARCMATTKAGREPLVKYIGEQWWTMVNNHHWKLVSWESCLSI